MAAFLTSAQVARLTGVGTTTIKRWAASGELPCVRTPGGHRRFRREDVVRAVRKAGPAADMPAVWTPVWLASADSHQIQARLLEERARLGTWHAVAARIGDLLREIGRHWENGELTVIEEHLASAALDRALGVVIESLPLSPVAPRCLLAVPDGDEHTLGLALVDLCLREAGWRTEWAGRRTRAADIVERVVAGGLRMVALSAAASASDRRKLQAFVRTVGKACRLANVALALGGEGAWPAKPADATRFFSFSDFSRFAKATGETSNLDV